MLFDWLVTGHIWRPTRPFGTGTEAQRPQGQDLRLSAREMHELLAGIDTSSLLGLRDSALIALMGYTFRPSRYGYRHED